MTSSIEKRLSEFTAFERAMSAQKGHDSELAQVLITASYLDNQLRTIIEAFLVEARSTRAMLKEIVEGPNAPMGTFSSRIKVAYMLGLINDLEYRSTEAIRSIRNRFAHDITASFEDEKLTSHFDKLAWVVGAEKVGDFDRAEILFIASLRVSMMLTNRADHVALERRVEKEWPRERTDVLPLSDWDHLDRDTDDLDGTWGRKFGRE